MEVDKLSASAVDFHFDQYIGRLCDVLGVKPGEDNRTGLVAAHLDSYEVGCQNWTQGLEKIFERRIGYSMKPYFPVFARRVVGSVDETERFLEDFRRLLAELFAENYADRLAERCHQRGLKFSLEPYGHSNADDLRYGQAADIPMAEFWNQAAEGAHATAENAYCSRQVAYIAHVWGRRFVAAEAFTSCPPSGRWLTTPYLIKAKGDRAYAEGVNRVVYHRFAHQPWTVRDYLPGMTMGRYGMHLDRTQTWWHIAPEFFRYQSRCQWMLQEGRFVADVLFWRGEDVPAGGNHRFVERPAGKRAVPKGYNWDVCATEAVEALKVKDGKVVVPGGTAYALLVLPDTDTMSERMVWRVGELLDSGAKVVAPRRPSRAPGLVGTGLSQPQNYQSFVAAVWAKGVMECSVEEALRRLSIEPDYTCDASHVAWIHRTDDTAEWYFVAANNETNVAFDVSLRVPGKVPEIWDAETGGIRDAREWRVENGRTVVSLDFPPSGSAFVVFRRNSGKTSGTTVADKGVAEVSTLPVPGPWKVSFPVDWYTGGNAVTSFEWPTLKDWTSDADPDVKYFSGTATYKCKVESATWKNGNGGRIILDLGEVKEFAEVTVNGKKYPPL